MTQSYFGWHVVGAAFVVAVFGWGINFFGPPVFLQVLHTTRGWPISSISAAITVHFLAGAGSVANLAALHRRFGVASVTRAGAVLTAAGLVGWAFAPGPAWLFLAAPIGGAGWAMTSGAALNAMVSPWFARRRPAALSMAFNGASLGGVLFSPLWVAAIGRFGFHATTLAIAATVLAVLWVLSGRYFRQTPATMGLAIDGEPTAATPTTVLHTTAATPIPHPWRDRRFVTLAIGATLGLFAQIGLIAHLFSILAPILGDTGASAAMGGATALAIGGRSLLGWTIPPHANRRTVAAANLSIQAIGSIVLLTAGTSVPCVLLGTGLFGLGLGNVTSLPPLIAQTEFATADVPRVVALVTALGQAGYAFAPALFGVLRECGNSGTMLLFGVAATVQLAAAGIMPMGRRRL